MLHRPGVGYAARKLAGFQVKAAAPPLDLHPRHAHLARHRAHVPVVRTEQLDELRPAGDVRLAERTRGDARHRVRPRLGRRAHDLGQMGELDPPIPGERHAERQRLLQLADVVRPAPAEQRPGRVARDADAGWSARAPRAASG